ncbi:MAG: hypothetical protein IPL52_07970 [Flavobacteriales bacterium]|nr:hypothetical protein [Flavobacteriales bacterium]
MRTLQRMLHCDGRATRRLFARNVAMLGLGKAAIDLQVLHLRPDLADGWSWPMSWLNPFTLIDPWLNGEVATLVCLTTFAFFAALAWNAVHRARDAGWSHWIGMLAAVPFLFVPVILIIGWLPPRKHSVWDLV